MKRKKARISCYFSPVQTVMTVDDSFNYHTRFNTNNYQLLCSLGMFKFYMMIVIAV